LRPGVYRARLSEVWVNNRPPGARLELTVNVEVAAAATTHDFHFQHARRATGRLVFDPSTPPEWRTPRRVAFLVRDYLSLSRASSMASSPDRIDRAANGAVENDQFAVEGRLQGDYVLRLDYRAGRTQIGVALPDAFALDTTHADQDLGSITVPVMGALRLRLNMDDATRQLAATEAVQAVLVEPGVSLDRSQILYISLREPDQTIGPLIAGTYELRLQGGALAVEPSVIPLTIVAGATAGPIDVALRPDGVILGTVTVPGTPLPSPLTPSRVTLTGPGVSRTVIPEATLDAQRLQFGSGDLAMGSTFRFAGLAAGAYAVTVEAPGYASQRRTVDVTPGRPAALQFTMTAR
jgi:hypothetical protein